MKKLIAISAVILGVAGIGALAQKKGKGPGILQPQMKVEGGTYAAPMGKLGQKPAEPWTQTTLAASVDGKPNPGAKISTVTGEILDFSCYLQITEDGTLYMLMEEEHDLRRDGQTDFRKAAIEHAAHIMEVTGTVWEHGGVKALYVHGFLKK